MGAEMGEDLETEIQKRVSHLEAIGLFACTVKSLGSVVANWPQ